MKLKVPKFRAFIFRKSLFLTCKQTLRKQAFSKSPKLRSLTYQCCPYTLTRFSGDWDAIFELFRGLPELTLWPDFQGIETLCEHFDNIKGAEMRELTLWPDFQGIETEPKRRKECFWQPYTLTRFSGDWDFSKLLIYTSTFALTLWPDFLTESEASLHKQGIETLTSWR